MASKSSSTRAWSIEEKSRKVHNLYFHGVSAKWNGRILFQTDEHWDNPQCDLKMLKQHHEEAKETNSPIVKVGDVFCAMQGKYDKRASKDELRPEHQTANYLDALVDTATEWYLPYKDQIALITPGNHELSILNHHETSLTTRLAERLRSQDSPICVGGYASWLRLHFSDQKNVPRCRPIDIFLHHGWGGGGPVTKGLIDFNRLAEQVEADVYLTGHIHYKNYNRAVRSFVTSHGIEKERQVYYVRSGTYKNEFKDQHSNWHITSGRAARPMGGWWMNLGIKTQGKTMEPTIKFEEAD